MYADEINETSHRGRAELEPSGSDGFGRAARVGEGRSVNFERTDQLVFGDVGYDNDWRRELQIIRE